MDTFARFEQADEDWEMQMAEDDTWLELFRNDDLPSDTQRDIELAEQYGM
jgi:hypothetical protein